MALETSKRLLFGYINYMFEENDIDSLFYVYHGPRSKYDADQFAKMVETYLFEVKREISKLENYSKLPKIDFIKALKIARSIKARSIWIGAKSVRFACPDVVEACLVFNEESFSEAVVILSNEFKLTKMRFETYLEMHRAIKEKEKQLEEEAKK